ncbi:MAG: hypothetical protein IJ207_06430 [Treponema sp.]|uniref:hypothetical protein n=1 Tax=Treponema sp. TaxID=166 RepID=UPI0025F9D45A|nr:hypothetical protein [Treponema sp.]MBQ9281820.1 hypothetical protein [Treponema sp.]
MFAAAGKEMGKKSLSEIAMSYGYVYVGQIALGANPAQALKVIQEAEAYNMKARKLFYYSATWMLRCLKKTEKTATS